MQDKILVKIVENTGKINRVLCDVDANTIEIVKPRKGAGNVGWKPKYNTGAVLTETIRVGLKKKTIRYVMIRRDAEQCINFDPDNVEATPCTRKDLKRLFASQVMHAASHIDVISKAKWTDYLIIGLVVTSVILQFI